ncbi:MULTISPECIES: hypothetical protein [Sphingobium]|uniref:hypothetical protein n=1 Tax=Sphingobium TaxID=165695 RepID=UPI0015EC09DF|nr:MULTISPECIES: hypothetical protein [Sphingobium]MCW2364121.1 hypothetical protein [Sphingobium sp. B10D3B]MCW2385562.1 hypothetical protein [Sphingobium sp. B2D3D]MCW2402482.1 hypothetical protein [Sphingobium sp. B10D7B]MCW2409461.1 hypothetical protein [Sphingobium xanthum]
MIEEGLRIAGVVDVDTGDDFSFEFPLRDLYFPEFGTAHRGQPKFGLFIGWELRADTAQAFLEVSSEAAAVFAWRFTALWHQCGGHLCSQEAFLATPMRVRADTLETVKEIVDKYWYSNLQRAPAEKHFTEYKEFTAARKIAVDEALARTDCFMESVYPMDASRANLERLAADPDRHMRSLEPFMENKLLSERLCIFLISDNCD